MNGVRVTGSTFIRNNFTGGFCLFESMASILPFVDDMIIYDLGSNDGTYEVLNQIEKANPRIRVESGRFTRIDASAFADAANQCVRGATHNVVWFWQADEIWHERLLRKTHACVQSGKCDLNFWRYQLKYNWQHVKWYPHPVHRIGPKDNFVFYDDGMNTERRWGVDVCSDWNMGQFAKWETEYKADPPSLPTWDMILDVSQVGGFLGNIVDKRKLHSPFWHESDVIEGEPAGPWYEKQKNNPDWKMQDTPFNIPYIMRRHLGRQRYGLDDDLLMALKGDYTIQLLDGR